MVVNGEKNLLITADKMGIISVVDLETTKTIGSTTINLLGTDQITQLAVNEECKIVLVLKKSGITMMEWDGSSLDINNKNISYFDKIKRIYFPTQKDITQNDIICITNDNKVKQLNIMDFVNNYNTSKVLFERYLTDQVILDKEKVDSVVFWTNTKKDDNYYPYITVQRMNKNNKEEYILDLPVSDGSDEYLIQAALHRNNIAAVSSYGNLYWWKMLYNSQSVSVEGEDEVLTKKKSSPRGLVSLMKRLSGIFSCTSSDEDQLEYKQIDLNDQISPRNISPKVSPRFIDISIEQASLLPDKISTNIF
jgi:hypothetical protein